MRNDTILKTIIVAVLLCIFCSVLVSGAAVYLKPLQEKNKLLETKKNILIAAGLMKDGISIEEEFNKITVRLVDLQTGEYVTGLDANKFDVKKAVKDPKTRYDIPKDKDLAKIKVRSRISLVYLVMSNNEIETIILPIHGKGLWSTMYAFMALEKDANTVKGLSFYEHLETPGLGGEVDNVLWKKKWPGKKVYNQNWEPAIDLPKSLVDPSKPESIHQVDGLSGATLTTRGIEDFINYWMGQDGYGPFLSKLRAAGVS